MSRLPPAPEQIVATQPDRSNWVSANAGAGKTFVLTQRVARLLLDGALPERILCLTFTKAAAAEMQTRLFRLLGGWAMMPDADLGQRLGDLADGLAVTDPQILANARRLFARALETPGGLKIQTIHAFCERLLRRFPLEAGVSPRFQVMDDAQTELTLEDLRARMALASEVGEDGAFDRVAARLTEEGVSDLSKAVLDNREPLADLDIDAGLGAIFGQDAGATALEVAKDAVARLDHRQLALLADVIEDAGGAKIKPVAAAIRRQLSDDGAAPLETASALGSTLLRKTDGAPRKDLLTKALLAARPSVTKEVEALADWAVSLRDATNRVGIIARTRDLYDFGGGLLTGLQTDKDAHGFLDFQDLVARARRLLTDADMRGWVLYKLDQGIDHILVDEAQDTSPDQWEVIRAIAEEFLSGQGARSSGRSIFVVGDEKQSIYSFQGAEPRAFGRMRTWFAERLAALGTPLGQPRLETSYRSAPAVLRFVDAVFHGEAAQGLTASGAPVHHKAHRAEDWGRVDLWPLIPVPEKPDEGAWWQPVDKPPPEHPKRRLADAVASHIADLVAKGELPARRGAATRQIRASDIMVLLSARYPLASWIIRALKARGVPVAGADRLKLTQEIAVQDLMALMRVVTMPSDDLSLAALLRSPLCGLSEDALFDLAHGRGRAMLWQALDQSAHTEVAAFLGDMAKRVDFDRPYEFIERVLIHHDGRRKLLARLGPEAEDAIDELLVQALVFEAHEVPSMAGFVAWLDAGDITVKREMDRGLDAVRVMTVHGAKGLEAPIVILPDTVSGGKPGGGKPSVFELESDGNAPGLVIWAGSAEDDDPVAARARQEAEGRAQAERARLLYVALTRAEDWLILCGADLDKKRPESWYPALEAGMDLLAGEATVVEVPSPTGDGVMRRYEFGAAASGATPKPDATTEEAEPTLPAWLCPAPYEPRVTRGAPSGLGEGLDQTAPGGGRDPELARRRGTAIHLALERLADVPPADRWQLGEVLLAKSAPALDAITRADALDEAMRVFDMPEAETLFGPDSLAEVTVAIDPPDGGPCMVGRIDRLVPTPGEVLIVDIKTDAVPAADPEAVPGAYLAQLGAYAAGVAPAWPGYTLRLGILWTATPALMRIDPGAADHAFRTVSFARTGRA